MAASETVPGIMVPLRRLLSPISTFASSALAPTAHGRALLLSGGGGRGADAGVTQPREDRRLFGH